MYLIFSSLNKIFYYSFSHKNLDFTKSHPTTKIYTLIEITTNKGRKEMSGMIPTIGAELIKAGAVKYAQDAAAKQLKEETNNTITKVIKTSNPFVGGGAAKMHAHAQATRDLKEAEGIRIQIVKNLSHQEKVKIAERDSGLLDWLKGGRAEYAEKERERTAKEAIRAKEERHKIEILLEQAKEAEVAAAEAHRTAVDLEKYYKGDGPCSKIM